MTAPKPPSAERDPLVGILREIGATSDESGPHLDATELAAWLDHALEEHERPPIEAHLAACSTCRGLVLDAREAIDSREDFDSRETLGSSTPSPVLPMVRPRRHRWLAWAAAAAVAFVALGGVILRNTGSDSKPILVADGRTALGLRRGLLPPHIEDLVDGALQHQWSQPRGLDGFDTGTSDVTLRSNTTHDEPLLLGPRWSTVSNVRPAWTWLAPMPPADEAALHEVLLVDSDDQLVFEQGLDTTATLVRMPFPKDAPSLTPGRSYAWKVSTRHGDTWLPSRFVPFRVLSETESTQLDHDLHAAEGARAVRAVVLAHHGVVDHAVRALTSDPDGTEAGLPPLLDQWTTELLRLQRLGDDDIERIRLHLGLERTPKP